MRRGDAAHDVSAFFVPQRSILCERLLKAEGVYGDVAVADIPVFWVPQDTDVLSLELDAAFKVRPGIRDPAMRDVRAELRCLRCTACKQHYVITAMPVHRAARATQRAGFEFAMRIERTGACLRRRLRIAVPHGAGAGAAAGALRHRAARQGHGPRGLYAAGHAVPVSVNSPHVRPVLEGAAASTCS